MGQTMWMGGGGGTFWVVDKKLGLDSGKAVIPFYDEEE